MNKSQFLQALIGNDETLQQLHDDMKANGFKYLEIVAGVSFALGRKSPNRHLRTGEQSFADKPQHLDDEWVTKWLDSHTQE